MYLQRDEWFRLERVVAVVHPTRPIIAYHLLWRDDVNGSWIPFTVPTDQEIVWVGRDTTTPEPVPRDLWTYWHGTLLHADWRGRGMAAIDVQWGKHGSLPRGTIESDLPRARTLNAFYALTWALVPDALLGRTMRRGPVCFCKGYDRYRDFSRPLVLADRIDVVVRTADPDVALRGVFGQYSRKPAWPR